SSANSRSIYFDRGPPLWNRCFLIGFFFSSRRRHTSSYGDWSSDVCSSDLRPSAARLRLLRSRWAAEAAAPTQHWDVGARLRLLRSEERRVGKECRAGWPREH